MTTLKNQIQAYGDSFTPSEKAHATSELRDWFVLETWTTREGLLLLVGIDPHRSDDLVFNEEGIHPLESPTWARITERPGIAFNADGTPRITGYYLDLFQIEFLGRLLNVWVSNPGHATTGRHAPGYFVQWAISKGLKPFWQPWIEATGLMPPGAFNDKPKADKAQSPGWTVNKPKRIQGYNMALYLLLEEAHVAGKPKPTAHDVLRSFRANMPNQIAKVIEGEGFDFYIKNGNTKPASLATIAERIRNMTN